MYFGRAELLGSCAVCAVGGTATIAHMSHKQRDENNIKLLKQNGEWLARATVHNALKVTPKSKNGLKHGEDVAKNCICRGEVYERTTGHFAAGKVWCNTFSEQSGKNPSDTFFYVFRATGETQFIVLFDGALQLELRPHRPAE